MNILINTPNNKKIKLKCTKQDINRFWSKVSKFKTKKGCLEWLESTSTDGYGKFKLDHHTLRSHRLAYVLSNKEQIPDDMWVLHTCDNPLCCNPDHLWLGDNSDNQQDMVKKGRYNSKSDYKKIMRGVKNGKSKLTNKDVHEIRKMYKDKNIPLKRISGKFNVSQQTVVDVATGKTWTHIKGKCEPCKRKDKRRKLSFKKAHHIRKLYKSGKYSQTDLSEKYNVSLTLIGFVIKNKIWREI